MTFFFFPPPFLCRVTQRRSPLKRTPPIFTGGDNWGEPNVSIFWVEVFFFSLSLSLSLSLSVSLSLPSLPPFPSFLLLPPSLFFFLSLTLLSLPPSLLFLSETNYVGLRRGAKENRRQCVCVFFFSPLFLLLAPVCVVLCCVLVC